MCVYTVFIYSSFRLQLFEYYKEEFISILLCNSDTICGTNQRPDHAVTIVGYEYETVGSEKKLVLIVKNSWGEDWGLNGYFKAYYKSCSFSSNQFAGALVEPYHCMINCSKIMKLFFCFVVPYF